MSICRYCGKEIESGKEATTHGYWEGNPFPCHVECKAEGEKREAYECQTIDADCNDCANFERGEFVPFPHRYYKGTCRADNKPKQAFAKFASGHKCFIHRRSFVGMEILRSVLRSCETAL